MVTIDPSVFYAALGALLTAAAFALRQWSITRTYTEGKQADGQLIKDTASAGAWETLSEIAKTGNVFQQQMIKVVEDSTRANEKSAAEMRGMVAMMDGFGTVLKNAVLGIDETQAHITSIHSDTAAIKNTTDSLETNLGESIKGQFGPVVEELKNIGTQISVLVVDIQSR